MLNPKQIPSKIGYYVAGFTDGEGSFNVSFRQRVTGESPWRVSLSFNISQKDPVILALCKKHLQCGGLRQQKNGVWQYEVQSQKMIETHVIPFFNHFGFLSAKKKRDFSKFKQIAKIVSTGGHKTKDGVEKIVEIRREMNDGGKRKYSDDDILRILRDYTPNA